MTFDGISLFLQNCNNVKCLNIYGIKMNDMGSNIENSGHEFLVKRLKEKHVLETIEYLSLWYPLIRQ